ncbi:MAG: helix-turn-helix domain-containing protein [Bacilli bacterium]|jgi:putative transcriptional regulator
MALSYNKLWKLLIDKEINKTELHELTGLSLSTINKLTNGENVNTEVLERICKTLNCNIEDIVEMSEEEK